MFKKCQSLKDSLCAPLSAPICGQELSRRDLLTSSLSFAAALVAPRLVWSQADFSPKALYSPFIKQLNTYADNLEKFLKSNPLKTTDWSKRKLWEGGDDGLLSGALDYDLIGRTLEVYKATGDSHYLSRAVEVASFLKATYLDPTRSQLPAYRIYVVEGYYELSQLALEKQPELAQGFSQTVRQIAENAGFAELNTRTEKAILHPSLSREVALLTLAKRYALRIDPTGLRGGQASLEPYVRAMKNHFILFTRSLLTSEKTTPVWGTEMSKLAEDPENYLIKDEFVRPFMVGISARAATLLDPFTNQPSLLPDAADSLLALKRLYVHGKGLPYTDRLLPASSQARQLSADTPDDSINPSLNLLVANACDRVGNALKRLNTDRELRKASTLLQLASQLRSDTHFTEGTLKETKQALY